MNRLFSTTVIIAALFFTPILPAHAQKGEVRTTIRTNNSFYSKEFKPMELGMDVAYYITDDFHAGATVETAVGLFKLDEVKTYYLNGTYGIQAGYRVWKFNTGSMDANVGLGNVMSNKDWRYLYYDANVHVNIGRQDVQPFIGLGLRYYDARGKVFDNYLRGYISLGFSFSM